MPSRQQKQRGLVSCCKFACCFVEEDEYQAGTNLNGKAIGYLFLSGRATSCRAPYATAMLACQRVPGSKPASALARGWRKGVLNPAIRIRTVAALCMHWHWQNWSTRLYRDSSLARTMISKIRVCAQARLQQEHLLLQI